MKKPTNVEVSASLYNSKAAASWHMDGARFHVWFDTKTMEMDRDAVIYKNPINQEPRDPGYFSTRKLHIDSDSNAQILKTVFEEVEKRGLIAVAIEVENEKERQRQAANEAYKRAEQIKEAAPELYAALERIMQLGTINDQEAIDAARDALAKARSKA